MLKSPFLFAVSVLVTLMSWTGLAKASEDAMGLNFALPPTSQQVSQTLPKAIPPSQIADIQDLVRYQEALPPLGQDSIEKEFSVKDLVLPSPSPEKDGDQLGLSFAKSEEDLLVNVGHALDAEGLKLENRPQKAAEAESANNPAEVAENAQGLEEWIFEGGSDSLVARTVGSAEGTRHWSGAKTSAYYGHVDPGNGVWNRGTFSYQHEALSPEDADAKQMGRLKLQNLQLGEQAQKQGLKLTLEERLNGVDLANQAPLAALDRGGYIEQLAKARRLSMEGNEAIVYARTHAYLDPDTKQWNAPGLGNTVQGIDRDQRRRAAAIAQAHQAYIYPRTHQPALSNFEDIRLVEPVSEGSQLSFALPPTTPALLTPLSKQSPPALPEASALNNLSKSPLENPDPGIHFSATNDAEIMAVVEADQATALPTVTETFSDDSVPAEPAEPSARSAAIASPTSENDEVVKLPPPPQIAPIAPGTDKIDLTGPDQIGNERGAATVAPDSTAASKESPVIVPVPPVAPPIGPSLKDMPDDALIRQQLWGYEDKIGDNLADKAGPTTAAGK